MKKLLLILLATVFLFSFVSCAMVSKETSNSEKYEAYLSEVAYSKDYMPSIDQCGEYVTATATYKSRTILLFDTSTVGLFITYDDVEYQKQIERIASEYAFFSADDEALQSDCDAVVGEFSIRLVKTEYDLPTYKMGLLIGTDHANSRICYLYYYDFDLDVLDDLEEFIYDYFRIPG